MTEEGSTDTSRFGRRSVLRTLAAGAVAGGASLLAGGPAWSSPAGSEPDVRTLVPGDLSFSETAAFTPYSVVSPNFRRLDDRFRTDILGRYERLSPVPGEAEAGLTAGGGALRAAGTSPYFTLLRSATAQRAPYSAAVADVRALAGCGGKQDTVLVGLARDADRHIMGWYNNATGTAGVDVTVDGEVTTVGAVQAKLTAPFRLAFTLAGPGVSVLADEGDGWRVLTQTVLDGLFDLRGIGGSVASTTFDVAPKVPADGTLGQLFTADRPFTGVGGRFPTYRTAGCAVTLSLYRGGPGGELVTRSRLTDVPDNAWQFLTADEPLPAGTYYLEQSQPSGPVAWWTSSTDAVDWGTAYENGEAVEGDRTIRVLFPAAETAAQLLAAYRNTVGVRADSGTIVLDRFEAGYFGQAGVRDPCIVTWPDGRPYIRGGSLYLTLTNNGLGGGISSAHMGVFRMPLDDYGKLEEVGKIFQARGNLVLGDHAGQVVYDPAAHRFRVMAVTFGDNDVYGDSVTEYATARDDILHGVSVLAPRPVVRGIDPYPVRIDGRWLLALSDGGRTVLYRFRDDDFNGPAVAAENDNGGVYYEGTKLCRIGPEWYVLTSSGSDYRVYDLRGTLVGNLDAPHPSGYIPHPMVLPVPLAGNRTRFLHLSMEGVSDPVSGAFGRFRVNTSDQTVRGREFPAR